ncbi:MAG: hypothetical protein CMM50_10200 [Rhodospirillaceae bacterium]|nr:hypothetical protein [Rhodospirillaceae bacterium]
MALNKAIELNESGLTVDYWRITHVIVDRITPGITAVIHGYANEALRRAGKGPVTRFREDLVVQGDEVAVIGTDAPRLADLYGVLKQRFAEFTDAEDRLEIRGP